MNPAQTGPHSSAESNGGSKREGFFGWLDRRTGIDQLLRAALAEPIPGGARFAYVFGSGLLFLFLSQIITGVFLAMYYVPSAEHAHVTVAYLVKVVAAGSFLRSVHAYGSSAVMIVLLLHLTQVFLFGSYKGRRELLWLAGVILLFLMAGMAFTGYLLPWDQNAYFATTVGTNLISQIPWIGQGLTNLLRGGPAMGTLTVSRFYVIHVFLLPALIFLFVIVHVYLFRRAGAAGPPSEDPFVPRQPSEMFYPGQVALDMVFTFLVIGILAYLSYFHPFELGPAANPANTQYYPRPEWYYRPMFQELKYFPGRWEVVGSVVLPGLLVLLLILAPFIDRSPERRPWKRPVAVGTYCVVLVAMLALGVLSYWQDSHDESVARQLRRQHEAVESYMEAPFKPYRVGLTAGAVAPADPLAEKGKAVYTGQGCSSCHGDAGAGTPMAAGLAGVQSKFSDEQLATIIRNPPPDLAAAGMPGFDLSGDQMQALIAYLHSLQ
jgi:ubiquinol-cytochrome c reductase cytochrome b subunit